MYVCVFVFVCVYVMCVCMREYVCVTCGQGGKCDRIGCHRPHHNTKAIRVYFFRVGFGQHDFRRHVPKRSRLPRHLVRLRVFGPLLHTSTQAEVEELQPAIRVHSDVLGLQISVDHHRVFEQLVCVIGT